MTIAAAGGPSWTDILTAIGTVGAVIVAVGIALWGERRSGKRIADERTHSRTQLEEERRIVREREQLAQAYAVQVTSGEQAVGRGGPVARGEGVQAEVKRLAVIVLNHGSFTITRVDAQLCLGGNSMQPYHSSRRFGVSDEIPPDVVGSFSTFPGRAMSGVLTPFDRGIRFETDDIHERHLVMPYPVVRWMDHWGTTWEHKRGVVRQVSESAPWEP